MATLEWNQSEQAWVGDTEDGEYRVYVDGDELSEAVADAVKNGGNPDELYDPDEWLTLDTLDNDHVRVEKIS